MKTLLGFLLIGLTTYAQADPHKCDHRALDIIDKGNNAKFLKFDKFVGNKDAKQSYYVPWTTINSTLHDKKFQQFCSGSTFTPEYCGVTYYQRGIINGDTPQTFRSYIELYSYSIKTAEVTLLKMRLKLKDNDDYIFQAEEWEDLEKDPKDSKSTIKAYPQHDKTNQLKVPNEIKKTLDQEFALFEVLLDGKVSIFVACDEDLAWASVAAGVNVNDEVVNAIEDALKRLEKLPDNEEFKARKSTTYVTPYNKEWPTLFTGLVAA